ncbi:MAG: Terminase small subunit [Mesorhizobium sp.]|nr:MAG: Terminase small subunit [Mesorhizobium sp.]
MLANARHENFVQNIIEGMPASRAYILAGYQARGNAAEVNAARLLRNAQVASRIAELRARQARRLDITVESVTRMLIEDRAAALAAKQMGAAVAASMNLAKLHGLIVDKSEVESVVRKPMREPAQVRQMTLEEWQRRFAPQPSNPQPEDSELIAAPEKAEPAEEISIAEAIRRAKEARRGKPTGFRRR